VSPIINERLWTAFRAYLGGFGLKIRTSGLNLVKSLTRKLTRSDRSSVPTQKMFRPAGGMTMEANGVANGTVGRLPNWMMVAV